MSQPSLYGQIVKRPWLKKMVMPLANWYANAAGYRKLGLKYGHLQRAGTSECGGFKGASRLVWVFKWSCADMLPVIEPMI